MSADRPPRRCWIPAPRCGHEGPGVAGHHVLGCDETGAYIEPEILVSLCQPDCHQGGVHRLLKAEGIDGLRPATPGVLIGRIGVTLSWLGIPGTGELTIPDWFFAALAEVLLQISRELRRAEALG
jgi:hypothetical protein